MKLIPVFVLLGLSACTVATPDTSAPESVASTELAIRDPLSTMCTYYTECDDQGNPIGPGGGGGGGGGIGGGAGGGIGGMGGGEGSGSGGEGGGGGGGTGGTIGDLPQDPLADLYACRTACEAGAGAMGIICTRLPPAARPECWAVGLVGGMACYNFCAWHFT